MEPTQLKGLESYLKTENEHWNTFAYGVYCKAVEQGLFTDPAQPLQLIEEGINILEEKHENPATGVQVYLKQIAEKALNAPQQLFVYKSIDAYLEKTEFDNDLTTAQELLQSHAKRLRKESVPAQPLVKNIREMLKDLMQKELETLPQTLQGMEPEKRLNIVCKLIPYVLPKVDSIEATKGEPGHSFMS